MKNNQQINRQYWDSTAQDYQQENVIRCDDFHYGPLAPGDREVGLLPHDLRGISCLELGCGGAQNSIFLASRGARCAAIDISLQQLLSTSGKTPPVAGCVSRICGDLDALPIQSEARFDMIHSVYALPFVEHPEGLIAEAARRLAVGGRLIISTIHPLFAYEWLELDEEGFGSFVHDYFHPPQEWRFTDEGDKIISRAYPVSTITGWITSQSLVITRILEPSAAQSPESSPYTSPLWEAFRPQARKIPVSLICEARKID